MPISKHCVLLSFLVLSIFASESDSQCPPVFTFTGETAWGRLGYSVSGAGDVNNDGFNDLIVGSLGRAHVYSGQSGTLLYTFNGEAGGGLFGHSVSGAGDVNNDGFDDLIVGAYANDAGGIMAGQAYVYSGQSGALLYTFTGQGLAYVLGWSVSGAGDVNNDGFDDLIVGAHGEGGSGPGRAYVYSGQNGVLLHTFTGEAAGDLFGWSVSGAGDVNNDGFDDLIVGARWNDAGDTDAGRVYVYSGQNGVLLHTFTGDAGHQLGGSVSGAGDVNNDGFDDLFIGAGQANVYSGENGALLQTFTGEAAGDIFGHSVSGAGDVNNDGFNDLVVGAPENDAGGDRAGRAYVYYGSQWLCADANGDSLVTIDDVAYLQDYYFDCSTPLCPLLASDVNCDGIVDIRDIIFLSQYLNGSGPEPCCMQ